MKVSYTEMSPNQYAKHRLAALEDMCIVITEEEEKHILALEEKPRIDSFVRKIIADRL